MTRVSASERFKPTLRPASISASIKVNTYAGPLPDASALQIGRSTKADALALLGPPRLVRRQFDGELYTWRRTLFESQSVTILPAYVKAFHYSSAESHRDDLSLLFDHGGVLRGKGLRLETEERD